MKIKQSIFDVLRGGCVILLLICLSIVSMNSYAEDMLSKEDARQTFNLTFQVWASNVRAAHEGGVAKGLVNTEYEWTLLVPTEAGVLKVTPSYLPSNLTRPHKIMIGIEQTGTLSQLTKRLRDDQIIEIVQKGYRQMLPEFTVLSNVDLAGETVQYNFVLFEVGRYPEIDQLAGKTLGCMEVCVKR